MRELSTGTRHFFSALPRAISGALAGTVVFTLMMKFLAPEMIGHPMDIAAVLGHSRGSARRPEWSCISFSALSALQ